MSQKEYSQDASIEKSKELVRQSAQIWNELTSKTIKTEVQNAKGEILTEIEEKSTERKDLIKILLEEFFTEFEAEISAKMARKLGRIENEVGNL